MPRLKKNLKKLLKLMRFYRTAKNAACMTVWGIMRLKRLWWRWWWLWWFQCRRYFSQFGDIFGGAFGGGGRQQRQRRGSDLRYVMELTLEEAVKGVKTITFTAPAPCDVCDGKGSKNPKDVETCKTCHGSGQVRMQRFLLCTTNLWHVVAKAKLLKPMPCMSWFRCSRSSANIRSDDSSGCG